MMSCKLDGNFRRGPKDGRSATSREKPTTKVTQERACKEM